MRYVHDKHVYDDETDSWHGPFPTTEIAKEFAGAVDQVSEAVTVENYVAPRVSTNIVVISTIANITGPAIMSDIFMLVGYDPGRLFVIVSPMVSFGQAVGVVVGNRSEINSGNGLFLNSSEKIETTAELFVAAYTYGTQSTAVTIPVSVMQGFNS